MFDIDKLTRENIKKLIPYSSARDEFAGEAKVFLDANENPFETGLNRYPDPYQLVLKQAISKLKNVTSNQIFLGNGSDEVIDLLLRAFCEPGQDNIIILPPTYGMYKVSASINDVQVKEVPLTKEYQLDAEGILSAIDKNTKLIFVCSPNNPTGNDIDQEVIVSILRAFNGIVVIDEAYIDFTSRKSFITQLEDYPNLLVMQTFSKAWGLAGIRLGMAFCSENIIRILNKIKPPYNINELTQKTALKALENKEEMQRTRDIILSERELLKEELEQLNIVEKVFDSSANFLLVRITNALAVFQYLMGMEIIVRNRANVILCEDCLRITIGTEAENKALLDALKKYQKNEASFSSEH
ncbi:histidinol-phosphate transaminase [Fulvivirgaceae bacterium BMA10]|uniref:Histidinol-phosphate aminotransferase n=1 Tax=Splendidivirga corallicola TaxID=3051826 RepID=A0ABT8KNB9_9BACT|nr:histidinol-phosphate transaminase [Fulvivirgaceae bacterium BMA10]